MCEISFGQHQTWLLSAHLCSYTCSPASSEWSCDAACSISEMLQTGVNVLHAVHLRCLTVWLIRRLYWETWQRCKSTKADWFSTAVPSGTPAHKSVCVGERDRERVWKGENGASLCSMHQVHDSYTRLAHSDIITAAGLIRLVWEKD